MSNSKAMEIRIARPIPLKIRDIVKKVMKNQSANQRKTKISLPLEGGGNKVGVKELRTGLRAH